MKARFINPDLIQLQTSRYEVQKTEKSFHHQPFFPNQKKCGIDKKPNLVMKYLKHNQTTQIHPRRSQMDYKKQKIIQKPTLLPLKLQRQENKPQRQLLLQNQKPNTRHKRSNTNEDSYYLYWKNKALEYQQQNFQLLRQNGLLKLQLENVKKTERRNHCSIQKYNQMLQKNILLQQEIAKLRQSENQFLNKINGLQYKMEENTIQIKHILQNPNHFCPLQNSNFQLKYSNLNNYHEDKVQSNKKVFQQNVYLQQENNRYKQIIKDLHQQLVKGGIETKRNGGKITEKVNQKQKCYRSQNIPRLI